ncbi:peptidoglycan DD-metalloendopeptidase family protein [Marinobacteraceae bacterium S3BR75-40.1]
MSLSDLEAVSAPHPVRRGSLCILAALLSALLLLSPVAGAEPQVSQQKLDALKERISDVNEWLEEAEANRGKLLRQLRDAEREISRLNASLRRTEEKQQRLNRHLDELKSEQQKLETDLENRKADLKAQIRSAWSQGEVPALKVLLNEANPQKLARTMTYYEYLSSYALEQLKAFNATLKELRQNRQEALDTRKALAQTHAEQLEQREALDQRKGERQAALASLKTEISAKQNELTKLKEDREQLEKLLRRVEKAVAGMELPKDSTPFHKLRAKLPWPTRGKVTAHFGDHMAEGRLRRNGIVIAASPGTPVKAVHYGRVVFANWLRGFGLLLIVDHGDGYMSLYGQNESLLKSPGDWVRAGETIALSGNSGGARQPGLYFEIRKGGKPRNPLKWLRRSP